MTENQENIIIDPANRIRDAYASPIFLALAILTSGAAILGLNLLYALAAIAMWITYAAAKGTADMTSGLAFISGVAKAAKIVMRVAGILLIVCAVLLAAVGVVAMGMVEEYDRPLTVYDIDGYIEDEMGEYITDEARGELFDGLYEILGEGSYAATALALIVIVAIVTFVLVSGIIYVVLAGTFYSALHKFSRSVCENAKNGAPIEKAKALSVWLIVMGVFSVFALADELALSVILCAAVYILGSVWIKKYFQA